MAVMFDDSEGFEVTRSLIAGGCRIIACRRRELESIQGIEFIP
jgi:hypothetical protein